MYSVTVAALYTVLPCVIAVTMTIMYRAAKKNETKLSKYGVGELRAKLWIILRRTLLTKRDRKRAWLVGVLHMFLKRLSFRKSSSTKNDTTNSETIDRMDLRNPEKKLRRS